MANAEATTPLWFALRLGPSTFGVFDAFTDESGRQAHLNGPIAKALIGVAAELFAKPPTIESIDVLGAKLPGRKLIVGTRTIPVIQNRETYFKR